MIPASFINSRRVCVSSALPLLPHQAYVGLQVLDLSQGIAGPYCAQILQQLGASVVKVEPREGDWSRSIGLAREHMSAIAMAFNRGKRSLACDARHPEGRHIIARLAQRADVVIQSFRPGVAERLGLGYDALQQANPGVIYVSVSGFGLSGPYARRPATDAIVQAVSGMTMVNRPPEGLPTTAKPYVGDISCGLYAANLTGAALFARERSASKRGTHLEVSLLACLMALQNYLLIDQAWRDGASATPGTVPQGVFRTADGHVVLAAMSDAMFATIGDAIGQPQWRTDPRLRSAADRLAAAAEIQALVTAALREHTTDHWTSVFADADVLFARVQTLDELLHDPQVQQQGLLQAMPRPGHAGALPFVGLPGVTPGPDAASAQAPGLGQHTLAILQELDYDAARIAQLRDDGVIAAL